MKKTLCSSIAAFCLVHKAQADLTSDESLYNVIAANMGLKPNSNYKQMYIELLTSKYIRLD